MWRIVSSLKQEIVNCPASNVRHNYANLDRGKQDTLYTVLKQFRSIELLWIVLYYIVILTVSSIIKIQDEMRRTIIASKKYFKSETRSS